MIRILLPLATLALAGCAHRAPMDAAGVQCDARKLGALTGRPRSAETEAEALRLSGAKSVRWLAPDSMATMDFRPDRLNLHTDAQGRIREARCG